MNETFLSIIIPSFNERDRLPATLKDLLKYLGARTFSSEIIVVDDGSTDETIEFIQSEFNDDKLRIIRFPKNLGKGAAVKEGVLQSRGKQVLFMDADGSTPIQELPKLQKELADGIPLAIGSRRDDSLTGQKQPFYRVIMGKIFNLFVKGLMGADIQDTQCGFKLIEGNIGRYIFKRMKINGFSFDVELLYLANLANIKIAEVPVIWLNDARSKVQIWKDPLLMFLDLLRIKLIHLKKDKFIPVQASESA